MEQPRQGFHGIVIAATMFILTLGSLAMTLSETEDSLPKAPEEVLPTQTSAPAPTLPPQPSPTSAAVMPTSTPTQEAGICRPLENAGVYVVQLGDDWESIAGVFNITVQELLVINCQPIAVFLSPGTIIKVPGDDQGSPDQPAPLGDCNPPENWVRYTIKEEDTLYSLSVIYNLTVSELQQANCLGDSTQIVVGEEIFVPSMPAANPTSPSGTQTP